MEQKAYKHAKKTKRIGAEPTESLFKQKCPTGRPPMFVHRHFYDERGKFFKLRLPKYIGSLFIPNNPKVVSKLHKVKKIYNLNLLQNAIKPLKLVNALTQQRKYIKYIQNSLHTFSPRTLAYFPSLLNLNFFDNEVHFWSQLKSHFRFESLTLCFDHSKLTKLPNNQELFKRKICKIAWKSSNLGFLKHLTISTNKSNEEFVRIFLLQLNVNPLLFQSLKTFNIHTQGAIPLPQELHKFVTSLSANETSFKSNKISLIGFQNLVHLELKLQEDDLSEVMHLGLFKRLRKLT